MFPPRQCCCCLIYQGVEIWTIVFICLNALGCVGMLGLHFGFSEFWCGLPENDADSGHCLGITLSAVILYAVEAGIMVWGLLGIQSFNGVRVRSFGYTVIFVSSLRAVLYLRGGTDDFFMFGFALSMWYACAVLSLSKQMLDGTITQDNPTGTPQAMTMSTIAQPAQPVNLTMDRGVISAAHKGLGVIEPEIKSLFETIDHDSSGALSRAEVAQLLADQNIVVESTFLDGVLDAYDLDQSGEIELEEFAALYTVLRRKAIASPDAPPPAAAGTPPPAAAAAQRKPPPPLAALTPPAGKKGPPPSLAGLRPTGA